MVDQPRPYSTLTTSHTKLPWRSERTHRACEIRP